MKAINDFFKDNEVSLPCGNFLFIAIFNVVYHSVYMVSNLLWR